MEKEPKERRTCPLCGTKMSFIPGHHASFAYEGGHGQFTPAQWTCQCGHQEDNRPWRATMFGGASGTSGAAQFGEKAKADVQRARLRRTTHLSVERQA